jgi:diacylglycerol kinase family enzyme
MTRLPKSVLLISPRAGSAGEEAIDKLRRAFPSHQIMEFDPAVDLRRRLARDAQVIVAGGDGTIGAVARQLVDSDRRLGIIPLGTFNNFARALGVPDQLDEALEAIRSARTRAITVGRINREIFLEVAAIGMFGDAIAMGEAAKDFAFGDMARQFGAVSGAQPIHYTLTGDIEGDGQALSLVFANTPSAGARMALADGTPTDDHLELAIHVGATRTDLVGRLVGGLLARQPVDDGGLHLRFKKVRVRTKPRVRAYADNRPAGQTPATVEADSGALKVLVPT